MNDKEARKKLKEHPFYDVKKGCKKTAWDTPEHLTQADWAFALLMIAMLSDGDFENVYAAIMDRSHHALTRAFFNRVIGWPEGLAYCRKYEYCIKTAFPGIVKHQLPKLKAAMTEHRRRGDVLDYTFDIGTPKRNAAWTSTGATTRPREGQKEMKTMKTQNEIRAAFWTTYQHHDAAARKRQTRIKSQNYQTTDCRLDFCAFVDMLENYGEISEALANRATL